MNIDFKRVEQRFFRALNSVVEPTVRAGLFSPRLTPSTLIVLESTGYKSGKTRRTPLLANRFGRFLIVSTVRGEQSFWVRNLARNNDVTYFLGGRQREARALVLSPEGSDIPQAGLPRPLQRLVQLLSRLTERGWAFAVLVPPAAAR